MIVKKFELWIAFRYLRTKRKEAFISVIGAFSLIGIALGVATLIIVMSVMKGYEVELINRILGINSHVSIHSKSGKIANYGEINNILKTIKHVKFSAPLVLGQAMTSSQWAARGVMVRGMDVADMVNKPIIADSIMNDVALSALEDDQIVIGVTLAQDLGVMVGDKVKIITPNVQNLVFGMVPKIKTFRVGGIFDVGMYEYNSTTVFMPMRYAQLLFETDGAVTDIEVVADSVDNVSILKYEMGQAIRDSQLLITDWSMANQSMVNALRIERNVMFFILSLIILIAAFNIISSLIMLVKDKHRSIAILRTIGVQRSSILNIFIISGFIIGLIGTFFGCVLGVLFTLNIQKIKEFLELIADSTLFDPVIYFLTELPAELSISNLVIVSAISLILSFLATIYPAWKAANVQPASALRYE